MVKAPTRTRVWGFFLAPHSPKSHAPEIFLWIGWTAPDVGAR
jgi:hypothetical protein